MQTPPYDKRTNAPPWAQTGQRLREARQYLNLSQEALAEKIGASVRSISRWERGEVLPYPHMREQLCQFFGMTTATLFELGEEHEAHSSEKRSLWHIPFPRNPFFTGRDPLLEVLHQRLVQEHRAALSQSMVLSGLGGIGKTATAIEYAYRHVHDYTALFWIGAESPERLVSSFVTLAETLNLPERLDSEKPRVVSAVQRWLMTHQGWLLIFDNVEDLEIVKPFVPTVPHGSILFTTRLQAVGTLAGLVTVETMGLAEGTLFLLRRAKLLQTEAFLNQVPDELLAEAEALVIELDFLPLALDQAGAYIDETRCSLSGYLELYCTRRRELLQRRGHVPSEHPEPVSTTWSLSFQKIGQANPAAAELLCLCAFLDPDTIPEELFREGSTLFGPALQHIGMDALLLNAAIEELRKFSLVQRDPETRLLCIHRLVQAVLKDAMETKDQRHFAEQVVRATNAVFPESVEAATWSRCQRYLAQAQVCSRVTQDTGILSKEAAALLFRTATYLQDMALYTQAEPLFQCALAMREQLLNQERSDMAHSLKGLAILYHRQGKYEQAEDLFQRVLLIRQQMLDPDHPEVVDILSDLANLYREQGKYVQAEPLLQRAIHIREQGVEPDDASMAQLLQTLANIYLEQGKYGQAEPLYHRTLRIRKAVLEPLHIDIAHSLNQLASLFNQQGKYEQAEPLYQEALHLSEQLLGLEHPNLAYPLIGLANLSQSQGKHEHAEPLYRRALHIWEQAFGPEHPNVAYPLSNLAALACEQRKYEQAEALDQRALHIWEQAHGPEHPNVAYPLNNLANLYQKQGKYEQAESLYHRALRIWEQALGSEHPNVAEALHGLATLSFQQGRDEQAEPLYLRALRIREHHLSPEHPDTAETLHDLATLRERQENRQEACVLYQRALTIREQAFGSAHPKTEETRICLITLLRAMEQQEEAARPKMAT